MVQRTLMNTFIMNMNIKTIIIAVAAMLTMTTAMAQRPKSAFDGPRDITKMVSDLSSSQKKRLDAITDESKPRIDALRAQRKAVRDSIAMYIQRDGDQSEALFPLFEREAQLQSRISREMYMTKVRIDEVLTPEQRRQVRDAFSKPEQQRGRRKSHN